MKDLIIFFVIVCLELYHLYRLNKEYKYIFKLNISLFVFISIVDIITFGSHLIGALSYDYLILIIVSILLVKVKKYTNEMIHSYFFISIVGFVLLLPIVYLLYFMIFTNPLTTSDMFAIYQSNINESLEFLSQFIPFYSFIPIFLLVFVLIKMNKKYLNSIFAKKLDIQLMLPLLLSIGIIYYIAGHTKTTSLYTLPLFSYKEYTTQLKLFKKTQSKVTEKNFEATKKEKGELTVVVIGESLNRYHMSLYGYKRDTTPHLKKMKNNLVVYTNTYSNDVETMGVLSYALTQTNQLNNIKYFNAISLANMYKKAGYKTIWLTNQQLYGKWDNLVAVMAHSVDKLISFNNNMGELTFDAKYYDGKILEYLNTELKNKTSKNKVIFIHLMGSHGAYKLRYPKEYEKYKVTLIDAIKDKVHINKTKVHIINAYDNSIYYNDYVVSSIIKKLQNINEPVSMIYFSDHSEDLTYYKGHGRTNFTYELTQIPLFFYFSQEYKEKYPTKHNNIVKHKDKLYCNDMVYDTMIGISNIITDKYNPTFDLSSNKFKLLPKDAYTMHRLKKYSVKENPYYKEMGNE